VTVSEYVLAPPLQDSADAPDVAMLVGLNVQVSPEEGDTL
jgi:hypothetical protein